MRRIALAVIVALTGVLLAAPAEGKRPGPTAKNYRITEGEGTVRVTFRGDEAAGCRARGTCGISGTTTYAFGGEPQRGQVFWLRHRKRTITFSGYLETDAETVSDVVTAGSDEHCVDRRSGETYEGLIFEPRSQRVRFNWRKLNREGEDSGNAIVFFGPGGGDPFDTRCAGPELADLAGGLPIADVPYRVFRSPRSSFRTTGTRPFAGGGFAGTVEWDLGYSFQLRPLRRR